MSKPKESILVIPRDRINCFLREGFFQCRTLKEEVLDAGIYMERTEEMERNPAFKQPIPYACIVSPSGVLVYQRVPKEGESRLHSKLSIGFGGHVEEPETYMQGFNREIYQEELIWTPEQQEENLGSEMVGFVNIDDLNIDNGVHAVHLGGVHVIRLLKPLRLKCPKEEAGKIKIIGYMDPDDLRKRVNEFEAWSKTLIQSDAFIAELGIAPIEERRTPEWLRKNTAPLDIVL